MKLEYKRILRVINEASPKEYLEALNNGWEVYEKRLLKLGIEEVIFYRQSNDGQQLTTK